MTKLLTILQVFFAAIIVVFSTPGCKKDNQQPPDQNATTCQLQTFFFTQANGTIDSNVYTFGSDGRIASFRRIGRAPDGTITPIRNGELFYSS